MDGEATRLGGAGAGALVVEDTRGIDMMRSGKRVRDVGVKYHGVMEAMTLVGVGAGVPMETPLGEGIRGIGMTRNGKRDGGDVARFEMFDNDEGHTITT